MKNKKRVNPQQMKETEETCIPDTVWYHELDPEKKKLH